MAKAKLGFTIYSPHTLQFKKMLVKHGHRHLKKASIPQLAKEIFELPYSNNLDRHMLVAEILWNMLSHLFSLAWPYY